MKDYLIREVTVCERIQVGRATLALYVKTGKFPQPVRTRPNRAWRSSQVDRWIATLADQDIQQFTRVNR